MHIQNLYKETSIFLFKECFALEKIHGTSAHINWNGSKVRFFSGGEKYERFITLFDEAQLAAKFAEKFGERAVTVYGEAYGGSQQKMSATYGPNLKFIVFDVLMHTSDDDGAWLDVLNAHQVANHLGLEFVSYERIKAEIEAIDAQRDADSVQAIRNGMGPGKMREGIVLRPIGEVRKNNGQRVIAKHKRPEFAERQNTPKVLDADKLAVMQEAQAIADEWCTPMRLEHVLQKLPEADDVKHTRQVIDAMIEDIRREAAGEIVESKNAMAAIARKTAELWKQRLQASLTAVSNSNATQQA